MHFAALNTERAPMGKLIASLSRTELAPTTVDTHQSRIGTTVDTHQTRIVW
jgi:hypothetical protein